MAVFDPYAPDPPPPPDDGWTYPGILGGPPLPPSHPSPYYWQPGSPTSVRRRSLAAIAAIVLLIALVGGGIGVALSRLTASNAKLNDPVVDVNVSLGNGDAAAGTGIVLTSTGEVLTNNHVVENSEHISIQAGADSFTATVVGVDPADDVAVLRLSNASGLPTANLGDSSHVQLGDSVTAVGNALGRGGAPEASQGHVTALNQTITATDDAGANAETLTGMIQFDATIQPGDSGGPLYNSAGQIVGLDTAGSGHVGRRVFGSNQGFAIPINAALTIAREIASGTTAPNIVHGHRALLGVEVQDSASPAGALVVGVQPGSPADTVGLAANDVIVSAAGHAVVSVNSLRNALSNRSPGDSVRVAWLDPSGQRHAASVQLTNGGIP